MKNKNNADNWNFPVPSAEWDKNVTVPSTKYEDKIYYMNLHRRTCSCMESHPHLQGKIICRHQAQFIVKNRDKFDWPNFVINAFEDLICHDANPNLKYGVTSDKQPYVLAYSSGKWFSVYRNDSPKESYRYGYITRAREEGKNVKGAWAHNAKPSCHVEFEYKFRSILEKMNNIDDIMVAQ